MNIAKNMKLLAHHPPDGFGNVGEAGPGTKLRDRSNVAEDLIEDSRITTMRRLSRGPRSPDRICQPQEPIPQQPAQARPRPNLARPPSTVNHGLVSALRSRAQLRRAALGLPEVWPARERCARHGGRHRSH